MRVVANNNFGANRRSFIVGSGVAPESERVEVLESELPRPLFGPSLDHYLLLGVKFNSVTPLAVCHAEEAVFPTAEREIGHRSSHTDIDSYVAGLRLVAELARRRPASRENGSSIPVRALGHDSHRLVDAPRANDAEHRPEYLSLGNLASRRHIVENGRLNEVAVLVFRNPRVSPVDKNRRSF